MLCPGMGWSAPPDEVDAPVSAALDGLAVLEKARAEGRVRIDDASAVAAELWLPCAADAAARGNRAAVQRAMLGASLVSEDDMVVKIDWLLNWIRGLLTLFD